MDVQALAKLLRYQTDSMGTPLDTKRPIVFDPNQYEPHTELSMTATGHELNLPNKNAYYNVPTIHNGHINNPETFGGMNNIIRAVQQNPNLYASFSNDKNAVEAAIKRSKDIGKMRNKELNDAILMQYLENK